MYGMAGMALLEKGFPDLCAYVAEPQVGDPPLARRPLRVGEGVRYDWSRLDSIHRNEGA